MNMRYFHDFNLREFRTVVGLRHFAHAWNNEAEAAQVTRDGVRKRSRRERVAPASIALSRHNTWLRIVILMTKPAQGM